MRFIIFACFTIILSGLNASAAEMRKDGKMVEVPVCGGFAGIECRNNQWCDYPASAVCGAVDQFGTCRPKPEICPKSFIPVCGCDGRTHGNDCEAARAGTDVAYAGHCRSAAPQ